MPPLRALLSGLGAAIGISIVAYPVAIWAFHPFSGPIDALSQSTNLERALAAALSVATFLAVAWRVYRGASAKAEMDRALDAYSDSGDS